MSDVQSNQTATQGDQDIRKNLLLFFDHPTEPIFMAKGEENAHFKVPDNYIPDEYKDLVETPEPLNNSAKVILNAVKHMNKAHQKNVTIRDILTNRTLEDLANNVLPQGPPEPEEPIIVIPAIDLPDLTFAMKLGKHEQYSFFIPEQRDIAVKLIEILMNAATLMDLESILAYCQPRLNPYLFNYCISVAFLHREDTKGMDIPTLAETFPDKFVDKVALIEAKEFAAMASPTTPIPTVRIKIPDNPNNPERRLAYFREDIGVSSHHWHWHIIYPTDGMEAIVKKDRRGELFYYMHHQVINRYNAERFCNGLPRTLPLDDFRQPIAEGYFPTLDSSNASRSWAPRFDNVTVYDVNRGVTKYSVNDMETWRERILAAIESQSVELEDGKKVPLSEETGIDVLGNLIESSNLSFNRAYYGEYHNKGHVLIAYIHDPKNYHEQQSSLMGDTATAMRDPVFYRWHTAIDDLFTKYKNKLTPYGPEKLKFTDVTVPSISVEGGGDQNTIKTLWQASSINAKNGLDFRRSRELSVEFTHLQHENFTYVIEVNNKTDKPQVGTFRIFMAPKVNHLGQPLSFEEQRQLMFEMDKFTHPLVVGPNTIRQSSLKSSVTIPFERVFRDPHKGTCAPKTHYCDCGWPHYMLVPKGTKEGFPMVLFVMVTNWEEDRVESELMDNSAFCGIKDKKYPDKRAMGFPFDRKLGPDVDSFQKFLQPNMAIETCTIKFSEEWSQTARGKTIEGGNNTTTN